MAEPLATVTARIGCAGSAAALRQATPGHTAGSPLGKSLKLLKESAPCASLPAMRSARLPGVAATAGQQPSLMCSPAMSGVAPNTSPIADGLAEPARLPADRDGTAARSEPGQILQ